MLPFGPLTAFSLASYPPPPVGGNWQPIWTCILEDGRFNNSIWILNGFNENYYQEIGFMFLVHIIVINQMDVPFTVLNSKDFCSIARLLSLHFTVLEPHMMGGFPQHQRAPSAVLLLITPVSNMNPRNIKLFKNKNPKKLFRNAPWKPEEFNKSRKLGTKTHDWGFRGSFIVFEGKI